MVVGFVQSMIFTKEDYMKKEQEVIHMSDGIYDILQEQRRAFIEKFGREPGPSDPVFFDPDCETPTPLTEERLEDMYHTAVLSTTSVFSKEDN